MSVRGCLIRLLGGPSRPPFPPAQEQLGRVADVVDAIRTLEVHADRVVAACGEPGIVLGQVGTDGGALISSYERLRQALLEIPVDGERVALTERVAALLRCRQGLVHTALQLAFTTNPTPRSEALRQRLNGLGADATRLRTLQEQVHRQLSGRAASPV
jgi:hypothetical protein